MVLRWAFGKTGILHSSMPVLLPHAVSTWIRLVIKPLSSGAISIQGSERCLFWSCVMPYACLLLLHNNQNALSLSGIECIGVSNKPPMPKRRLLHVPTRCATVASLIAMSALDTTSNKQHHDGNTCLGSGSVSVCIVWLADLSKQLKFVHIRCCCCELCYCFLTPDVRLPPLLQPKV